MEEKILFPSEFSEHQTKRIKSAKNLKIHLLDRENKSIIIIGSNNHKHIATLTKCSCTDFNIYKEPCKHMYRLFMELNILTNNTIDNIGKTNKDTLKKGQTYDRYKNKKDIILNSQKLELKKLNKVSAKFYATDDITNENKLSRTDYCYCSEHKKGFKACRHMYRVRQELGLTMKIRFNKKDYDKDDFLALEHKLFEL